MKVPLAFSQQNVSGVYVRCFLIKDVRNRANECVVLRVLYRKRYSRGTRLNPVVS